METFYLFGASKPKSLSGAAFAFHFGHANFLALSLFFDKRDDHVSAFKIGAAFDAGDIFHQLHDFLDKLFAKFAMRNLASLKHHGDLYLVPLLDEGPYMSQFKIKIMFFYLRAQAYLFNLDRVLFLLDQLFLFAQLVLEFAKIDNFANGRIRIRNDFNQIQASISCHGIGFGNVEDS